MGGHKSAALFGTTSITNSTAGIFLIRAVIDVQTSRRFGTGLAMIIVRKGDESSEERNSILVSAGSNQHKPIGSGGRARC